MARRIGWFDTSTKAQRKKKEERYESQMFPLGPAQKEAELKLLTELLPHMPAGQSLYYLLQFKEIVRSEDREEDYADWSRTNLAKQLSEGDRRLLWAVAEDSLAWKSLEDIPEAREIQKRVGA